MPVRAARLFPDLHKSWTYDSHRRLVINGMLWAARSPVPEDGARATFDAASLERNLDDKRVVAAKKK